jgi:hypothetical protein
MVFHHQEDKGVEGMMIIGQEMGWEETTPSDEIVGHWFENSGHHYRYIWEVDETLVQFWLNDKTSEMSFKGKFSDDKNTIIGTWKRPGGGYELTMIRA